MESRCRTVRSSAVTPMAATQSMAEMTILSRESPIRFIQRLTTGKPGFDVVPIFNPVLAELPAQVNNSALSHIREVAKTPVGVFQQDAHFLDLVDEKSEVGYALH